MSYKRGGKTMKSKRLRKRLRKILKECEENASVFNEKFDDGTHGTLWISEQGRGYEYVTDIMDLSVDNMTDKQLKKVKVFEKERNIKRVIENEL